jgi:hypothetical protein
MYRSYWRVWGLSTPNKEPFAHSLHALVSTSRRRSLNRKMKHCRRQIVMLFAAVNRAA